MGLLAAAIHGAGAPQTSTVNSGQGVYRAYFIGITDPVVWKSEYKQRDKCRVCKGTGQGRSESDRCFLCGGDGVRTETHIKLRYKRETGAIEEEEVNFKLAPQGQLKDGSPMSATKLYTRFRAMSQLRGEVSPQMLDEWFSSLPQPINIPVTVVIEPNANDTALKITSVTYRQQANGAQKSAGQAIPPQRQAPPPQREPNPFDDDID